MNNKQIKEITLFELTSIVTFLEKYSNMSKKCEEELLITYYDAMETAKITGDWNITINIEDKSELIEFLNKRNKSQKNLKLCKKRR